MKNSILFSFSFFLLPFLSLATDIATTNWGFVWRRGAFTNAISALRTPGSDRCETTRLSSSDLYAFLDGYDTRAICGDGYDLPYAPTETNTTARFAHWGDVMSRIGLLTAMRCGDHDSYWGSSAMEDFLRDRGLPMQTDFTWRRNPLSLYYDSSLGTGWMPRFTDYHGDGYFTNRWEQIYSPINLAWDTWFSDVTFRERGSDTFYRYLYRVYVYPEEYPPVPGVSFKDMLLENFETASTDALYLFRYHTYRLAYPTLATANQVLSLYDRTYYIPDKLVAITNVPIVTTSVRHIYRGEGEITFHVNGWNISDIDTSGLSFAYERSTNTVIANVRSENGCAPRATVSHVRANGSAVLYSTDEISYTDIFADEVQEYILNGGTTNGTFLIESYNDSDDSYLGILVVLKDEEGNQVGDCAWIEYEAPGNEMWTADSGSASGSASYTYLAAIDASPRTQTGRWLYPSNETMLASCDHTFLMAFGATTNYQYSAEDDEWRGIDFGAYDDSDWRAMLDYGYAAKRYTGSSPFDYIANLTDALSYCREKVTSVIGTQFMTDPVSYTDFDPSDARSLINNLMDKFEGHWAFEPIDMWCSQVYLSVAPDGQLVMEPPIVTIGSARVILEASNTKVIREPRSAETRIGGIIQANWAFPQLKRVSNQ